LFFVENIRIFVYHKYLAKVDTHKNTILETFLRLTNRTYPYGTEEDLVKSMIEQGVFPSDIQIDKHGNYFYEIGKSRTIFASHLDTVSKDYTQVVHTFDGDIIGTDGKTTLGADDKAGVTVMLHLIKNEVPGLYYFFIGEEVGCIGSGLASKSIADFKGKYDRIISFDRRGTNSVITYQSSSRCCSDEFADSLAKQLNYSGLSYKKDDGGVYTDSAEFTGIIPECTNVSVGYYKEHTVNETQDIKHLADLANACLLVDWENLPTKRDMSKVEYKSYKNYGSNYSNSWNGSSYSSRTSRNDWRSRDYGYHDDWYDTPSTNFTTNDDVEEWEEEYGKYKKTRRSNKRGRSYIDAGGGDLVPFKNSGKVKFQEDRNYYDSLIDKIVKDDLTREELEIVKDQYLDMTTENDRAFYQYLLGNIID